MARLLRVIELLSRKGGSNIQEIAQELGLNNDRDVNRTILPALRELGLRITEPDSGNPGISHRYWLDRESVRTVRIGYPKSDQVLLEPLLEPDEWMLLSFLLDSGGRLSQKPEIQAVLQRLRSKLGLVLAESSFNRPERELAALFNRLEPVFEFLGSARKNYPDAVWDHTVNPLAQATARQRICTVEYDSFHSGERKIMDILPLRLVEHSGSLYLLAYAAKYRNAVLPLEIGRFHSVLVQDASFDLPDIDLDGILGASFSIFIDQPRQYKIRFSASAARHVRERQWAPDQRFTSLPDGGLILDMHSGGYPDIRSWVLGWGGEAEALEPAELRADIRQSLRQGLALYETEKPPRPD